MSAPHFDRTDLKLELAYDQETGGYRWYVRVGDTDEVTTVEPWMLEAVVIGVEILNATRTKMEASVLKEFTTRAGRLRDARKKAADELAKDLEPIVVKAFSV